MEKENSAGNTLSTVVTAANIVEYIGSSSGTTPAEIAKSLNLARSNVHRMLATLQELGYVEQGLHGTYNLTFKLFELGNTVPFRRMLIDIARPPMLRLAQITGHTVNNAVMYRNEVLYIDKVEANTHLKLDRSIGNSDPLHSTSLGKVLLAFTENVQREKVLSEIDLLPSTPNTITDMDSFLRELENVRSSGYALDRKELSLDLICVAAPVFDCRGKVSSAVSVSGPADKFTFDDAVEIVTDLKATCREITERLCEV